MKYRLSKNILALVIYWIVSTPVFSQFTTCDTNLIYAHLNPAGYVRLYVPSEPCSMYFYNPTPMYGITAHLQAIDLGVPQLVINNAAENTAVLNALTAQGVFPTNDEVWMGITDSATTYAWRQFNNGEPAPGYTNWKAGEPNNASPTCEVLGSCVFCTGQDVYWCANGEDCAVMNDGGQWLDITCEGNNITHIAVLELNTCPVLTQPRDTTVCLGNPVSVTARVDSQGTAPYTYTWNPGAQSGQTVTIIPASSGTYTVAAFDYYQCQTDSTFTITINPNAPVANAGPDIRLCPGATDTLGAAPVSGYTYTWSPAVGLSSTSVADPTISFASNPDTSNLNTIYILTAMASGCTSRDTVNVTLYPNINNNFSIAAPGICINDGLVVTYSGTVSFANTYTWDFDSATVNSTNAPSEYIVSWSAPGVETISLSVTGNGCSDTPVSKIVTVYPKPSPAISVNGNDSLYTGAYPAYQWLLNGQPISGANTQSYIALANGNYQVVATDSGGCTDTSRLYTVIGVGIASIAGQAQVRVYPNPSNGTFIVETSNGVGGEISISDILGRVVMKQTITMDRQQIDMSTPAIAAGEYYVSIRIDGQLYTAKIVINKE